MMTRISFACCLAVLCFGCGKTARDVINEHRSQMDAKREQLRVVSSKLPPPGAGIDKGRVQLTPLPVFDKKAQTYNTEFLSAEQLTNPDAKTDFDLILSGWLHTCLLWSGPKNPMAPDVLKRSAGKDLPRQFDQAAACRYVVVYRPLEYRKPVVVSEKSYQPGSLILEVLLADLHSGEVLTSFRLSARSAPVVEYVYKKDQDPTQRAAAFAESSLLTDARKKLLQGLSERTGGTFVFDP